MKLNTAGKFIASLAIPQLAGALGAISTMPAITAWYAYLAKPNLAPPNWVFGPVWTTLFLMMGVSLFLVWEKDTRSKKARLALALFALQLSLNVLWSCLFFGLMNPAAAFVEVLLFLAMIVATIATFAKISKSAAWLLVPYLLWVSFASYLNYQIWVLNSW